MTYYAPALDRAIEVFGTQERAEDWLEKMSAELGKAPKDLLNDKEGYHRVKRHLRSVEFALCKD